MSKEVKRYEPVSGHDSVMRTVEWMRETPDGGWVSHDDYDAIVAERDALKAQQWVSVEDRLPDDGAEGLCALRLFGKVAGKWIVVPFRFSGGAWYPHYRDDDDEYFIETALDGELHAPTHWMPLPAPPVPQGAQP